MKYLLFLFISLKIFSTEVRHSCGSRSFVGNVATIGDSRAEQLALQRNENNVFGLDYINLAKLNDKTILKPNQLVLYNLGQVGSNTNDWVEKILSCQFQGKRFDVPSKIIINLGGNDLGVYLEDKYKRMTASEVDKIGKIIKAQFDFVTRMKNILTATRNMIAQLRKVSIGRFFKNPIKTVLDVGKLIRSWITDVFKTMLTSITGNITLHYPEYTTGWEWQDKVEVDRITKNMREIIIPNLLDQTPDHRAILNIIHPTGPNAGAIAYIAGGIKDPQFFYRSSVKLFNNLRNEFRSNLYIPLEKIYGDRILLSDTYFQFWNNILAGGLIPDVLKSRATYYIIDGIHFSVGYDEKNANGTFFRRIEGGLEYWGKSLALKMINHGWFVSDLDPAVFRNQYPESEVESSAAAIHHKSKLIGIDTSLIDSMPLIPFTRGQSKYYPLEPITIPLTRIGLPLDLDINNDKTVYYREGTESAFVVRGDILAMYEGNNGPDGILGYPLQDETVGSLLESFRTQNFECGTIQKNYLDILNPNKIIMTEDTDTCRAKKAREAQ